MRTTFLKCLESGPYSSSYSCLCRGRAPRSPRFARLARRPFPVWSSYSCSCWYSCSYTCLCNGGAPRSARSAPVFIVEFMFVFMFVLIVRFMVSIYWFDSFIEFINSMYWLRLLIGFMDSIHGVDSLIHWFVSFVRLTDSIHGCNWWIRLRFLNRQNRVSTFLNAWQRVWK